MRFRIKIDGERCKGCELCIGVCPRGALHMSRELNTRGQHYCEHEGARGCTGCTRCADICPDAAIEIDRLSPKSHADGGPDGHG